MSARSIVACLLLAVLAAGCKQREFVYAPEYARPLPEGQSALRKITDQASLPDLAAAYESRDDALLTALNRSLDWFDKPSTKRHFPVPGTQVSHTQAQASVFAFRQIVGSSASASEFQRRIRDEFDTWMSVGWNDRGTVLYTGYYTPEFAASLEPTGAFRYPLYKRPGDLIIDPATGKVMGRQYGDMVVTYPTRAQIERSNMLKGHELVYLRDPFDAYVVHVNGSAKLNLQGGGVMHVGYAGNNGHEYTSIAKLLVEDGKLDRNRISLAAVREYFRQHPDELSIYTGRNDRFVFFQEYDGANWPAGSLGVKVTPLRTLATDKQIFPRGGVVLVSSTIPQPGPLGSAIAVDEPFEQFMLDQDTGGAIRAAGRGDIYMGQGPVAEALAGRQVAEGELYYFFLKPHRVQEWVTHMRSVRGGVPGAARTN